MMIEASQSTAYLAFKLFLAYSLGKQFEQRWALSLQAGWVAGWLAVQAVQTSIILGLSLAGLMYRPYFLACWLLPAVLIWWQSRSPRPAVRQVRPSWQTILPVAAIAIVMTAMWARSVLFFDYTWDAQTYGLPRLIFWLNHGSVLVHMPTQQLNLFVNEWNGELNALAYGLASGSYFGFAFGNLEVLLMLFVAVAWLALSLSTPLFWALCIAAVVGSSPAMLGLASTVKGDLLACAAFVMAVGWLAEIRLRKSSPQFAFGMLLLCAAMAVAAKVSVVFPTLVVASVASVAIGYSGILRMWTMPFLTKLGMSACLVLFSSRLWANLVVYGDPLKRMSHERPQFGLDHLSENAALAIHQLLNAVQEIRGGEHVWALTSSMAVSTWFILVVAAFSAAALMAQTPKRVAPLDAPDIQRAQLNPNQLPASNQAAWLATVAALVLISIMAGMSLSPPLPWTFRYYAPGLIVLLVGFGAVGVTASTLRPWHSLVPIVAVFVVGMNLAAASRRGELLPTRDIGALVTSLQAADTPLKRATMNVPHTYARAEVDLLRLDSQRRLNILLLQTPDTSTLPFYGSHARNRITHVANDDDLLARAADHKWDVVTVSLPKKLRNSSLAPRLDKRGYRVVVDNEDYLIALAGGKEKVLGKYDDIGWNPWNNLTGVDYTVAEGWPRVESDTPVDAGFVSQELVFEGPVLVRAGFEGEISGPGAHAGHLSLHGVKPLITLPSGRYTRATKFQGVISIPGKKSPQRLSMGLGGWGVGRGHLKLVSLEFVELEGLPVRHTPQEKPDN